MLDDATVNAMKAFKKEGFADTSLSANYLKDRFKLAPDTKYNAETANGVNPPTEILSYVQAQLHIKPTGKMDRATAKAITQDKRDHWIDGRVNAGALDAQINSLEVAKEVGKSLTAQGMKSGERLSGLSTASANLQFAVNHPGETITYDTLGRPTATPRAPGGVKVR